MWVFLQAMAVLGAFTVVLMFTLHALFSTTKTKGK